MCCLSVGEAGGCGEHVIQYPPTRQKGSFSNPPARHVAFQKSRVPWYSMARQLLMFSYSPRDSVDSIIQSVAYHPDFGASKLNLSDLWIHKPVDQVDSGGYPLNTWYMVLKTKTPQFKLFIQGQVSH